MCPRRHVLLGRLPHARANGGHDGLSGQRLALLSALHNRPPPLPQHAAGHARRLRPFKPALRRWQLRLQQHQQPS